MHVTRLAKVRDGVVARLGLALSDEVGPWIANLSQAGNGRLSSDSAMEPSD